MYEFHSPYSARGDGDDLISMRQAYGAARTDAERREIVSAYESRHGITDVRDARHAAWYAGQSRDSWAPAPAVVRLSEDEQHERALQDAIDALARFEQFDAEHGVSE